MADTSFDIDIGVQSDGVTSAAAQLVELTNRLTAAGEASTAASEAVKAAEAAYRQTEASADRAAKALEKIGIAAEAQRGKLKAALEAGDGAGIDRAAAALAALEQREGEARSKVEAATAAMKAQAATLDQLKGAAKAAADNEEQLSKAHKKMSDVAKANDAAAKKAEENFGKVNELAEGFGKLGGPAGQAGQKVFQLAEGFKKLGASAGAAGPYVAVALIIIAVTTAVITATAALAAYAVKLADANRTQSALYAGMVQSTAGGAELEKQVDALASRVPLTQDKLKSMASDLAKTGLRGKELGDALEAAAIKASKAEFGPQWQKQTLSIAKQTELFQRNISKLFGGLNIERVLEGFAKLVGLFNETSTTGRAIKVVFDSLMQPLLDGLADLVPMIIRTFIQFEIWALRALIAIKPYGSTIAAVAKGLGVVAAILVGVLVVALAAAVAFAVAFLTVVSTVWRVIIDWGESMVSTAQAVWAFGGAIVDGAGAAFDFLMGKATGAIDWLKGLSLSEIGMQLIQGLATGLLGGGPAVFDAISGVVGGAIDSAKKLLGIASPSKVFAEIGGHTAAGMREGIEGGTGDVQASMKDMVSSPADGGGLGAGASSTTNNSSSSSSKSDAFAGATFIFNGVKDGADAVGRMKDALLEILDGEVAMGGAAEAPAT